ncbi:LysR family transcriptional regulator [Zavarzinia sp. CC-PAN008]|uniref:LysR family transcriptional regulator n=1 Tax=Zavarzinia sp. CC-PAN008 TaxID=3243332 RepID=UPI003F7472ED
MRVDNIDLRLLRVFHTLAQTGGFSGAQAELGLSVSTLSIHLSNLEQRLGVTLCERGRGGFRLTDKGERVLASTEKLLHALEDFRIETAALRGRLIGELAIGIVDNTVTDDRSPIRAAIRRFASRDSDVHVRLAVDRPAGLNHALLDGRINLAVAIFPHQVSGVTYTPLYSETNLLYCARGNPLFGINDPEAEAEQITRSNYAARAYQLDRDLAAVGEAVHRASVENMEALAHLLLSGAFIGFLPEHYAQHWVEEGVMRPIRPDRYRFNSVIELATPTAGKANPIVETFCADLRAENGRMAQHPAPAQLQ